jgi:hypothetical protein
VDLNRFVVHGAPSRTALWIVLLMFGGSTLYFSLGTFARIRRTVQDPEWRAASDVWSWAGILLLGTFLIAMLVVASITCAANVAWYSRAK